MTLNKILHGIFDFKTHITTYALIGKSGTGKSYHANLVAQKYELDTIIDDGLLIQDSTILGGKSAKNEKGKISSLKTAIFSESSHAENIKQKIYKNKIKKILILGLSEKMIYRITERLDLPKPKKFIHIKDVITEEEIDTALKTRKKKKSHFIPVFSIEVRKEYPLIFLESINVLYNKAKSNLFMTKPIEGSLVKPTFHKSGKITISEKVLKQIIEYITNDYDHSVVKLKKTIISPIHKGFNFNVHVAMDYGVNVSKVAYDLREKIRESVMQTTGIIVNEVNIIVSEVKINPSSHKPESP